MLFFFHLFSDNYIVVIMYADVFCINHSNNFA